MRQGVQRILKSQASQQALPRCGLVCVTMMSDSDSGGACYSSDEEQQEQSSGDDFAEGEFAIDRQEGSMRSVRLLMLALGASRRRVCNFGLQTQAAGGLQASYMVFNEPELRDRQRRSMDQVTSVLSVSQGDAVRLLCEYKWCALPVLRARKLLSAAALSLLGCRDVNRVNEEWFADMDAVRGKVGLSEQTDAEPAARSNKRVSLLPVAATQDCQARGNLSRHCCCR